MKKLNSIQQREVLGNVLKYTLKYNYYICLTTNKYIAELLKVRYKDAELHIAMPAFNKYIFNISKQYKNYGMRNTTINIQAWGDYSITNKELHRRRIKAIEIYIKRLDVRIAKHKKI